MQLLCEVVFRKRLLLEETVISVAACSGKTAIERFNHAAVWYIQFFSDSLCTASICRQQSHQSMAIIWELFLLTLWSTSSCLSIYQRCMTDVGRLTTQTCAFIVSYPKNSQRRPSLSIDVHGLLDLFLNNRWQCSNDIDYPTWLASFSSRAGVMLLPPQFSEERGFWIWRNLIFRRESGWWGLATWPVVDFRFFKFYAVLPQWPKRSWSLQSRLMPAVASFNGAWFMSTVLSARIGHSFSVGSCSVTTLSETAPRKSRHF